jgi:ribonuclease HII
VKALPDKKLWQTHNFIAGVDEAGRGPLAGPVVASAVILPKHYHNPYIDDSKKLTRKKRDDLYDVITTQAVSFGFGIIEPSVIDSINILNATKLAMERAIMSLKPLPEIVMIDALKLDSVSIEQLSLIKGDSISISIAAASILAKVKRDRIMLEYHRMYPVYRFDKHKGYPTELHRQRIRKHGACPIHRRSFRLL